VGRAFRELSEADMSIKKIFTEIWEGWGLFYYKLAIHAPGVIALIIGITYGYQVFINLKKDTTAITNTAFVILATLAALSFTFSRAVRKHDEIEDRLLYSGERFLHSALFNLQASLIKYIVLIIRPPNIAAGNLLEIIIVDFLGFIVGMIFIQAIYAAHTGIIVLNKILWKRMGRHPDWNNIF